MEATTVGNTLDLLGDNIKVRWEEGWLGHASCRSPVDKGAMQSKEIFSGVSH
jgi:hypothetical protein